MRTVSKWDSFSLFVYQSSAPSPAAMGGGGERSALFGVAMSPKRHYRQHRQHRHHRQTDYTGRQTTDKQTVQKERQNRQTDRQHTQTGGLTDTQTG